jgi:hypothetical protein
MVCHIPGPHISGENPLVFSAVAFDLFECGGVCVPRGATIKVL